MSETVIVLGILAALVSLQYWRGRRLNLGVIRGLASELEKALKSIDQEYTWIGGFVGIVGKYKIKNRAVSSVEATVSMLPRHSLLYLPVSLLLGRRDRIYFLIRPQHRLEERFFLKTGSRVKPPQDVTGLVHDQLEINGQIIHRWYQNQQTAELFARVLAKLDRIDQVKHLAVNNEENAYYAEIKITYGTAVKFVKEFTAELQRIS